MQEHSGVGLDALLGIFLDNGDKKHKLYREFLYVKPGIVM